MKTPISYYGGKQNLISEILPMFPNHIQYVEPFIGGGSLFFAKPKSRHEVINDFDGRLVNFYEVLKTDFDSLKLLLNSTLHSEKQLKKAADILKKPCDNKVEWAWAYWCCTQMTFSHKLFGGFAFSNDRRQPTNTKNSIQSFTKQLYERLADVEIFNRDAIKLILQKDTPDTFFYFDPPYAESSCGQYDKLKGVYYELLNILPSLKSQWLMSSYPSDQLKQMRGDNGWNSKDIIQNLSVSGKHTLGKTKTECLTWNYNLINTQRSIFDLMEDVA
jgi:DNA adenine methylase